MIKLSASADYGRTGQYIARITGRNSKWTFEREFIGRKCGKRNKTTEVDVDEPGLYEVCDVTRKNGKVSRYHLVLLTPQGGLALLRADKEDAMNLARDLDGGRDLGSVVECDGDDWVYVPDPASPRSAAETDAIAAEGCCWAALQALPPADAARVVASLQARLTPAATV